MLTSLEDMASCVYALCEDSFSTVKDYIDCIPESLNVLYSIAQGLGLKLRFATVSVLIDHVVDFNRLRESEVEHLLNLLKKIAKGEDVAKASKALLKMLLRRDLEVNLNEQEIAEIAISALYASLVKMVDKAKALNMHQIPSSTPIASATATTT